MLTDLSTSGSKAFLNGSSVAFFTMGFCKHPVLARRNAAFFLFAFYHAGLRPAYFRARATRCG
jgi:hypothetical protein